MADFEHNNDSGSLFVNERKTKPNHPDRTGSCKVDGINYRVSGWIKPGKNGKKDWLSIAFTKMEEDTSTPAQRRADPLPEDDDIPFN